MIGKLRGSRHFHRKSAFAPINIAGRRDTINEMIDTNTHDYTREVTARDTDESAMVKVRRNVNMHLKGQGKMQVSNGLHRQKNLYKQNDRLCLRSSRFTNPAKSLNDEMTQIYLSI